jgi:hypothetical protein
MNSGDTTQDETNAETRLSGLSDTLKLCKHCRRAAGRRSPPAYSQNLVGNYIAFIPLLHGRTMERHPCFVNRNNILAARNRSDNSPSREEVPVRQRTTERRRSELVENAARANCSTNGPPGLCRVTRDDRVQVQ